MKLLLDSHTLLWAIYAPDMLTNRVRELLADKDNELVISHAVLWEVLNKVGRGKLLLAGTSVVETMRHIDDLGVTEEVELIRPGQL
jgi:PIN domain nuclease of toxin-antitoxin system